MLLARTLFFKPFELLDIYRMEKSTLSQQKIANLMLMSLCPVKTKDDLVAKLIILKALIKAFCIDDYSSLIDILIKYNVLQHFPKIMGIKASICFSIKESA